MIGLAKPVLHRDRPVMSANYEFVVIDGAPRSYEIARFRAARATPGDLGRILAKAGTATFIPGAELPEGWRP